jgi:transposase-like protein
VEPTEVKTKATKGKEVKKVSLKKRATKAAEKFVKKSAEKTKKVVPEVITDTEELVQDEVEEEQPEEDEEDVEEEIPLVIEKAVEVPKKRTLGDLKSRERVTRSNTRSLPIVAGNIDTNLLCLT